jgi:hypothetical protein
MPSGAMIETPMTNDILSKLSLELGVPITTERQVVYILVQIRKLLDSREGESPDPYESLRLYCSWAVHTSLINKFARAIVREADFLYPRLITGQLTEDEKVGLRKRYSFATFRHEIDQFLTENGITAFNDAGWNDFVVFFLRVIQDCPLSFKDKNSDLANVDEVMLISELNARQHYLGSLPPIIWSLHYDGVQKFMVTANL